MDYSSDRTIAQPFPVCINNDTEDVSSRTSIVFSWAVSYWVLFEKLHGVTLGLDECHFRGGVKKPGMLAMSSKVAVQEHKSDFG